MSFRQALNCVSFSSTTGCHLSADTEKSNLRSEQGTRAGDGKGAGGDGESVALDTERGAMPRRRTCRFGATAGLTRVTNG